MIEITFQPTDGRPNWTAPDSQLQGLVADGPDLQFRHQAIGSHEAAARHRVWSSPTALVNGVDGFADRDALVGLACEGTSR